jgi:hypothetical protein
LIRNRRKIKETHRIKDIHDLAMLSPEETSTTIGILGKNGERLISRLGAQAKIVR